MKRILDHDPHTGLTQEYHPNSDGTFTIKTSQDVSPFLNQNAEARAMSQNGWKGEMHEVASIPPIVWHEWWKEFGSDPGARHNRKRLIAKLNSSDFLQLRVKTGRM